MSVERREIEIRTADGVSRGWTYRTGGGPRAGVLLHSDAYGVRPTMHGMAERIAGWGYVVLVPTLFYRAGEYAPFDKATVWSDPPERDRLMALIRSLTPDRVRTDAAAYLDALAAQDGVRRDRVGTTGYCMGGRLSFLAAALHPGRVRAAAAFHPGGLVAEGPESPHLLAGRVKAAVYVGFADQDRSATPEQQGAFATALASAGVHYTVELYAGKRHGYAVADHPGAHDAEAEARHWRRLEAFFGEHLG
jgi:carboxymethylenebutenolidase